MSLQVITLVMIANITRDMGVSAGCLYMVSILWYRPPTERWVRHLYLVMVSSIHRCCSTSNNSHCTWHIGCQPDRRHVLECVICVGKHVVLLLGLQGWKHIKILEPRPQQHGCMSDLRKCFQDMRSLQCICAVIYYGE